MAKEVGLSRKIKLGWFNKAVELLEECPDEADYKAKLNEYLSFEIDSPTVLRKTREILMRVWFYDAGAEVNAIREEALRLIRTNPDYRVEIHWCMLLIVYPVFSDICRIMGRIAELNDTILLKQLKQKLYDEWGERSTLLHSTDKIIATIKELGVISADKPGYYAVLKRKVSQPEIIIFMLTVAMIVDGKSYYAFSDLDSFGVLYPFEYSVSKEQLMQDDRFVLTNFDGQLSVALKGQA